ncbi:MAG: Two component regulator three Y domain-containing protein [Flavobacteriaceae bacterium]|nr:MAG: Two component regulator three Y domain-containing protein [Flavobacteriaceae bacterium]
MKKILEYLIILCFVPFTILAQNLQPPIQNYEVFDYNASSKNWSLTANENGELFSANNMGLLHFNGEEWKLNALPNKTIIRSVLAIGNKIYTGSYEEFGYWKNNDFGELEYTSLTHLIKGHAFTSEEFWQILKHEDAIYFRSFSKIYKYQDNKIEVLNTEIVVSDIAILNDRLVVAGSGNIGSGVFWLQNGELMPIDDLGHLENKIINSMSEFKEGSLLIGTKLNGCYVLSDTGIAIWDERINEDLKVHQLNKILPLTNGKLVFGTIKNGIYIYDLGLKKVLNLNKESGIQNNTVHSILQYKNQLWVGLDSGIDRVRLNNAINYYTDFSGELGTVYDIVFFNNRLFLGSNTGVYYFENDELKFVKGSQGHVWDLQVLNGELFCGHNTGTFKLTNGTLQKVSDISGGYLILKIPDYPNAFLQGTYTGISKFEMDGNNHWSASRVLGLDFPVNQICYENSNTIWAAHPYKGLYRIELDKEYKRAVNIKEFSLTDNLPSNYNVKLYNIENQIVFRSEDKWFKYDPILDRILPFEEFKPFENKNLIHYGNDHFWFMNASDSREIIYTDLKKDSLVIADPQLRRRLIPIDEQIIPVNDSLYYFTLSDGFGKMNLSKLQRELKGFEPPTPFVTAFKDERIAYPIIGNNKMYEVAYKNSHDISIKVASPSLQHAQYFYELIGPKEYAAHLDNGFLNFQNLPFGDYELKVFTVSMNNKKSIPNTILFTINPPWYLSKVSMFFYFLLFLGVIYAIRWYNRLKLDRKHGKLKEKMRREQEDALAQLENEKLAKEIKLKQKELTRSAMNMAKKNELILELKNMMIVNKDEFSNQQRYRNLVKKLDNSIKNKEEWKRFEIIFKELHEDFFEKLLATYPSLTPKDLRLCAYLKMNLSSKEIAPLMGITLRGVEIHRYRLRKKLDIDSAQNISNFLITFK